MLQPGCIRDTSVSVYARMSIIQAAEKTVCYYIWQTPSGQGKTIAPIKTYSSRGRW